VAGALPAVGIERDMRPGMARCLREIDLEDGGPVETARSPRIEQSHDSTGNDNRRPGAWSIALL